MSLSLRYNRIIRSSSIRQILLFFSWCLGLLWGIRLALFYKPGLSTVFSNITDLRFTWKALFYPAAVPFLFSALLVYFSKQDFLFLICFIKASIFAFCNFGIYLVYGQRAWFVRMLFLFADLFSVPLLYWYWNCHISGDRAGFSENITLLSILLGISSVDYFFVVPYLMEHIIS